MITITRKILVNGFREVIGFATPSDPKMLSQTRNRVRREREADYEQNKKPLLTVIHENSNIQPSE